MIKIDKSGIEFSTPWEGLAAVVVGLLIGVALGTLLQALL